MFVDIEGDLKPRPRFTTRAKMLWDDEYFYVAADMEEPHVWGKLTERDAVIYHDNDFEVFIDPDGDSHEYYELEINALGTEWDLLLIKPYRDGAPAVTAWDITGLKTAVQVNGSLNDPSDIDSGWTVEIAIPWKVMAECAHRPSPPKNGDVWWVNFSRVEWQTDIIDDVYVKTIDSATGQPLPENNWVWSPQGLIAMHYPEMWGLVQFSRIVVGLDEVVFEEPPGLLARHAMRRLYYAQRAFHDQHGRFSSSFRELALDTVETPGFRWPPDLEIIQTGFEAVLHRIDDPATLVITGDGRLRAVQPETNQ